MKRVWVNGAFDVLHVGHVRLLQYAASLGKLIVGINSDTSIRHLKGPTRPIYSQVERCDMLLALRCVDAVVTYDELDPVRAMRISGPFDISVKGNDYKNRWMVEREAFPTTEFVFFDAQTSRHTSEVLKQKAPCHAICGGSLTNYTLQTIQGPSMSVIKCDECCKELTEKEISW